MVIIIIVIVNMIICYHLIIGCMSSVTIFLDHISLVQQATHKYAYMWDAAAFLLRMWNKYSSTLPSGVIGQLLVLFDAIKIELYQ